MTSIPVIVLIMVFVTSLFTKFFITFVVLGTQGWKFFSLDSTVLVKNFLEQP